MRCTIKYVNSCSESFRIHLDYMRYIFIIILIGLEISLNAQNLLIDKPDFFYQISPIYDFKQGIVSLTFDDGYITQFTIGMPLLKERSIPATFYVVTGDIDSITRSLLINNLSKEFEIGSHTVTHPDLVKIGSTKATKELVDSQSFLQKYFGINAALTFSYPWGHYNTSIKKITKNLYLAARSSSKGFNSFYAPDKYALIMQDFNEHTEVSKANSWIDHAIKNQTWLIEMIHGINNVGYSPIDSAELAEHLDYIKKVEDKIWCGTVSDVIKYIDESKKARIECAICNDTVYQIRINDFLNDSIYNQPLSVRIKVPGVWDSIWISNVEKIKTEYYNNSKFILFNALPDNRLLTIRPGKISAPETNSGIRLIYINPNPVFDNIKIALEVFDQSDIDIVLCDMNGKLLIHQEERAVNGVINLFINTTGISSGIYLLRVSSKEGDFNMIKKLVKI